MVASQIELFDAPALHDERCEVLRPLDTDTVTAVVSHNEPIRVELKIYLSPYHDKLIDLMFTRDIRDLDINDAP